MNPITWIRSKLKAGDDWVDNNKARALDKPILRVDMRGNRTLVGVRCPKCGNHKVRDKGKYAKCTKCKHKF